jgi:hypothetical protein
MASGGVPQSWYPSSHTAVPVSIPQHGPERTQAPAADLQEQPAVQPNNINVAGGPFFTVFWLMMRMHIRRFELPARSKKRT